MAYVRLLLLIATVLFHGTVCSAKPAAAPAPEAWVERQLDRIIIPRVELRDILFIDAVDFLRKEARRCDPRGKGIPISLQLEPSTPAEPAAPLVIPGLPPGPNPVSPDALKITISLTKVQLREALRYFAGLANMKVWVRPDGVHIVPALEPEPMFTREFAVPADFFPWLEKQDQVAKTDTAVKTRNNFQEYLILNGVLFPEGASALLNPRSTRLTIRNTKDQLELIKVIIEQFRQFNSPAVPGPEVPKVSPPRESPETAAALKKTMGAIVLRNVVIKELSLRDAARKLGQLSVRYDFREPPRNKIGVNIVVKDPETLDENTAVDGGPLVSYSAEKVSLLDAVEAVAKLGGRRIEINRYAVSLVPKTAPETLVTWEFLVPPDFAPRPIPGPPTPYEVPDDAKNWLVSGGVKFPQPPSAVYIASSRRLIVRDTEERLKLVQQQTEAAWREYYAAHPPKKKSRR